MHTLEPVNSLVLVAFTTVVGALLGSALIGAVIGLGFLLAAVFVGR